MAHFPKYYPGTASAQPAKKYRLAWIGSSPQNPNPCGPQFGSLKEVQDAAPDYNAARRARGQRPCTYIVEYWTRRDPGSRNGETKIPTDLFRLDGTRLEVGLITLGTDPFDPSRVRGPK
jgi:hypothetical protein